MSKPMVTVIVNFYCCLENYLHDSNNMTIRRTPVVVTARQKYDVITANTNHAKNIFKKINEISLTVPAYVEYANIGTYTCNSHWIQLSGIHHPNKQILKY